LGIASTDLTTFKPTFNDTSSTQADIQAAADYAEKVGNYLTGLASAKPASARNGFMYTETDTGITWLMASGTWVAIAQVEVAGTITPASGYTLGTTAILTKRLGVAQLEVQILKSSGNLVAGATIATLPSGFIPSAFQTTVGQSTNGGGAGAVGLYLDASGNIIVSWVANAAATLAWIGTPYKTTL
jgi:hypothetical protein